MDIKKTIKQTLKGVILTCWIAGVALAVCVAVFHWENPVNQSQLTVLTQSIEGNNERLIALNATMDSLRAQLNEQGSTVHRHQSDILTIQSVQSRHKKQLSTLQSFSDTHNERLNTVQSLFEGQEKALKRLIQRAYRESKPVTTKTTVSPHKAPALSTDTQSKAQRPIPSPFQLFDVQKRGSTLLAAVAPHHATSLAQVALKRRGEQFSGWTILDVTRANIVVQKGNQHVSIKVTP
ncbi:hypothetical protein C9J12_21205 [Photobacterium frigidiphilum]|uniref:Uncharacterized protein n=1 Tax=Photobacterium frigidiphilum TaxID=264736 RepID=A0A2T3JAB2_9GAMM|nr:hypothetical protein [Photobacterium frigidiphilum]PSU45761.1 hypothetical protein C9J12_21205 [Photobacterium frigidiphilum]